MGESESGTPTMSNNLWMEKDLVVIPVEQVVSSERCTGKRKQPAANLSH